MTYLEEQEIRTELERLKAVIAGGAELVSFEGQRVQYDLSFAERRVAELERKLTRKPHMRVIRVVPQLRGR